MLSSPAEDGPECKLLALIDWEESCRLMAMNPNSEKHSLVIYKQRKQYIYIYVINMYIAYVYYTKLFKHRKGLCTGHVADPLSYRACQR